MEIGLLDEEIVSNQNNEGSFVYLWTKLKNKKNNKIKCLESTQDNMKNSQPESQDQVNLIEIFF
jgi:hypothetical protein